MNIDACRALYCEILLERSSYLLIAWLSFIISKLSSLMFKPDFDFLLVVSETILLRQEGPWSKIFAHVPSLLLYQLFNVSFDIIWWNHGYYIMVFYIPTQFHTIIFITYSSTLNTTPILHTRFKNAFLLSLSYNSTKFFLV